MILEGNERGYGHNLAQHLQNLRDNDHVRIHAIDGFIASDLPGAFAEAEAISGATQCQKYLFSLSLNPPIEGTPTVADFEDAIEKAEQKLGLTGQPRAIVFHEKNGRRHAHCVWSRIDATRMRAINLPHYKRKLTELSRDLFLQHDWEMPDGFRDTAQRDPDTFKRPEAQQAKREERDPKATKAMFRHCWETSDSRGAFEAALLEQGYLLARGDRRGFVAVDADGKVWSLSRWCGVKPKDLRKRFGDESALPSLDDVRLHCAGLRRPAKIQPDPAEDFRREALIARQRAERTHLLQEQEARRRQALLRSRPKGLKATFLHITGRYRAAVRAAEARAASLQQQDLAEQQAMITRHLTERRKLDHATHAARVTETFQRYAAPDPRQALHMSPDATALTRDRVRRHPDRILEVLSKTRAAFTRSDVLRALAKHIDDPPELGRLADNVLKSPDLVRLEDEGRSPVYTTRDYQSAQNRLQAAMDQMVGSGGFAVSQSHISAAIRTCDAEMRSAFGGQLSVEQRSALVHVLGDRQAACIVGLAGAGKSTLLATAMDAWRRQGVMVHGAALAGKAADGLQEASGIKSRTLAALELSWENGHEPIARGDVLVIDEAGMIGTRQLARVAATIAEIGAKLVLVGDPDQLQPIEAGTPFRDLVDRHGAARLTEIHRQRIDWQKQASRNLADGDIANAVSAYDQRGQVTRNRSRDDALEDLVEAYAMDVAANGADVTRLAFAHRRKDVHALNQAIRAALRPPEDAVVEHLLETETGPRAFAPGDRIVFGRNDRDLGVRNGMLGTVEQISATAMRVTLDGKDQRTVTFDPRTYRHFDHGYAVTVHKSQGATVDHAYVLASRSMDRHLAYVAMTRHRERMQLYLNDQDRPGWDAPAPQRSVQRHVRRDGPSLG